MWMKKWINKWMNDDYFAWQVATAGVRITHVFGRKLFVLIMRLRKKWHYAFKAPRTCMFSLSLLWVLGLTLPKRYAFHDILNLKKKLFSFTYFTGHGFGMQKFPGQ